MFVVCFHPLVHAQMIGEETTSSWKNFTKVSFKFNGTDAWYIRPKVAAKGNPWVWRAHFPNWHTEMDSILLERGFHVAYINTNDLYAHPKAMMVWDDFYEYLVKIKDFAPKVALEGVSRGGLYVYGWAKRNPLKVSCIYAEAPVADIKSWPGGRGSGKGSAKDWTKLLEVYQFTEAQALAFDDLPINHLEGLAGSKVPILHVVSQLDSIVPPKENTDVLVANYRKLGGQVQVISVTNGPQTLSGHHFPIEQPGQWADFIAKHSLPVQHRLNDESFIHSYGNLSNLRSRIAQQEKVTVAFLGGSITNMNGWRDKVSTYLKERFPAIDFDFINAGIPSLGSVAHAFRLKNDVLNRGRIDLMFIESAVNDEVNATSEQQQRRALEGLIRQAYLANPFINLVMMAFADENKIASYQSGKIPVSVKVHHDLAKYYKLNFINLAQAVSKRIAAGEFTWKEDFKNLHPSPLGQELYFSQLKTLLRKELQVKGRAQLTAYKIPSPLDPQHYERGVYENFDKVTARKGFTIEKSWKPQDKADTRQGFVDVPVLTSTQPGSSFSFTFKGKAVGLAVLAGPDAGMINYSIDGKAYETTNLYTKWSKGLHLPWYILLGDGLSAGEHKLELQVAPQRDSNSAGNACRIVHLLINEER